MQRKSLKILSVLLALAICFSLAACGGAENYATGGDAWATDGDAWWATDGDAWATDGDAWSGESGEWSYGPTTCYVSTVDEFLAAIAPDTTIVLAPGTYNLTEAADYGAEPPEEWWYRWQSFGFEGEYMLDIFGPCNLTILADGAEIVTEPRAAEVLKFEYCSGLKLVGLTAGHTEAAEACEGGVLYLNGCYNSTVIDASLYGCGVTGITAQNCSGLVVSGTEIHHCSSSGFYVYDNTELTATHCRIYGCGNDNPDGMSAWAAFAVGGGSTIRAIDCEVEGNNFSSLVCDTGSGTAEFTRLSVRGNAFRNLIEASEVSFTDLTLEDNRTDRWFGEYCLGTVRLNGSEAAADEFNKLWPDQLSAAGVGTVDVSYRSPNRQGTKEVHVTTADEFLAAIGSNTTVYIDVPQLNLTDAADYPVEPGNPDVPVELGVHPYIWRPTYDGWELCLGGLTNFHIVGGELITEPRYANVLAMYSCKRVSLEGVRLGHSPDMGYCAGGVVYVEDCSDVLLEGCDLYGCGTLGVEGCASAQITVQRTVIHDCSMGAAFFRDCDTVTFLGCTVRNCPGQHITLQNCPGFSWDKTLMAPNCSFNATK